MRKGLYLALILLFSSLCPMLAQALDVGAEVLYRHEGLWQRSVVTEVVENRYKLANNPYLFPKSRLNPYKSTQSFEIKRFLGFMDSITIMSGDWVLLDWDKKLIQARIDDISTEGFIKISSPSLSEKVEKYVPVNTVLDHFRSLSSYTDGDVRFSKGDLVLIRAQDLLGFSSNILLFGKILELTDGGYARIDHPHLENQFVPIKNIDPHHPVQQIEQRKTTYRVGDEVTITCRSLQLLTQIVAIDRSHRVLLRDHCNEEGFVPLSTLRHFNN